MRSSSAGRHPVITTLLVLLFLIVIGGVVAYFATDRGKKLLPTLENATMTAGNITPDSLKATMKVSLRNHVPVTVRIDSFSYITRLDGEPLAQGTKSKATVMKARGTSELEMPVNVDLGRIKQKVKTVQQDCVDVQTTMIMYADVPVVGHQRIPVSVKKRVYIPKLPKIEVADIDVTDLGFKNGEAVVRLKITNYNPFPFTIKSVNYRFRVGGDDLDVKGTETKDVSFRKRGTEIMPIHVRFQPKAMPKVAFKTLFKPEKTPYDLKGAVVVAAGKHNPKDMTMNFNSSGTLEELKNIPKK